MKKFILVTVITTCIIMIAGCDGDILSYSDPDSENFGWEDQYTFSKPMAAQYSMAESKDGYYFLSGTNDHYLYFLDKKTMKSVILCNKPDCLHANEPAPEKITNCNAFFMYAREMIFYNSSLLIFECNRGDASDIVQVSPDGTKRNILYTFKEQAKYAAIHHGYLYFSTSDDGTVSGNGSNEKTHCKLLRLDLTNSKKEPELIYDYSGINASIHGIIGCGDSIYFGAFSFTDSTMKDHTGMVLNYDTQGKTIKEIGNNMAGFSINGNKIVYNWDDKIYGCSFDGTDKKMLSQVPSGLFSDENYILSDTLYAKDQYGNRMKRRLDVFDLDGNKVSSIDLSGVGREMMYGGDENYLFIPDATSQKSQFGPYHILWAIDKHKLADGTAKPIKVFEFVPKVEDKGIVTKVG